MSRQYFPTSTNNHIKLCTIRVSDHAQANMETRGDHEVQVHGAASDDELNDDSSDTDDSSETS